MSPKKKSFLSAWIVVGIFVVLGGVSVYLDRGDKADRNKIKIFDVVRDELKSFELVNTGTGETVLCEKYGNDWAMVRPKPYEIEKTEVDIVVSNIAALTIDRKIEKPEALSSYGLEKPANAVSFTTKNGKKNTLLIGDKNPTGTFYYVKAKDKDDVYIAYGFSIETVIKTADSLRKKSLFEMEADKVNKVEIRTESKEFSLVRCEDKKWVINPYGFKANSGDVDKYLSKMIELKAKSIIEDNAADLRKYGMTAPRLTISAGLVNTKNITVLVGKKHLTKDEDYVKLDGSGVIYSIESDFLRASDKTYNDFREKKLLYLLDNDFSEVEILSGKKKIIAKKGQNGKYVISEPVVPGGAKSYEVLFSNFIRSIITIEAKSFVDDSGKKFEKYGLKAPGTVITLYGPENNERKVKAKIFLGDSVKNDYYVRVDSSESVFLITNDLAEKIKEIEKLIENK